MNDDIGKARITCPVCGTETTVPLDEWEEIVERHNEQRHGGDVGADLEEAILPEREIRTDGGIDQSVDGSDRIGWTFAAIAIAIGIAALTFLFGVFGLVSGLLLAVVSLLIPTILTTDSDRSRGGLADE